jgi:anti-anti-sigma regulatory factor
MDISFKKRGKFTILDAGNDGGLWGEPGRMREVLTSLIDNHEHHICVDLSCAPVVDSGVLGALVECHTKVSHFGGELVILNAHNFLLKAMMRTQLHRVMRFVENEAQL